MRRALIVGIDEYPGELILRGCVRDAESVYEVISRNEDGSTNFDATLLINGKSKLELKNALLDLFRFESAICLFYFAGHGKRDFFGYHMVTPDFNQNDLGIALS